MFLQEVPSDEGEKKGTKVADWKPQLHSVWDHFLTKYLEPKTQVNGHAELEESNRPKKKQRMNKKGEGKAKEQGTDTSASFGEFWDVVVDSMLKDCCHGNMITNGYLDYRNFVR